MNQPVATPADRTSSSEMLSPSMVMKSISCVTLAYAMVRILRLPLFRDRVVASRGGGRPCHSGPCHIDLLGILQRHPRRLPSASLCDRRNKVGGSREPTDLPSPSPGGRPAGGALAHPLRYRRNPRSLICRSSMRNFAEQRAEAELDRYMTKSWLMAHSC
jgi:hypothetical protein